MEGRNTLQAVRAEFVKAAAPELLNVEALSSGGVPRTLYLKKESEQISICNTSVLSAIFRTAFLQIF